MNFLGLATIGALVISILCGLAGASYEKKEDSKDYQESQSLEVPADSTTAETQQ